ncbi:hypothetical protein EYV94_25390 [Puteibacter caeruleilacunae]|nr:hypothetical protein EYV94_25390 [Puteibacter caeruleilacunae]
MKYINLILIIFLMAMGACEDPDQIGNLDKSIRYIPSDYIVTSGAQNQVPDFTGGSPRYGKFEWGVSSVPLTFKIEAVRWYAKNEIGAIVESSKIENPKEFTEMIKVNKYKTPVSSSATDVEKDLAFEEVDAAAVEIDAHRGFLTIHEGNKLEVGKYVVDVRVSNVAGERVIKDALTLDVSGWNLIDWTGNSALGKPVLVHENNETNVVRIEFTENDTALPIDQVSLVGNLGKRGGTPDGWKIAKVADNYFEFDGIELPFDGSVEFTHDDVQYYVHVSLSALGKYTLKLNFNK